MQSQLSCPCCNFEYCEQKTPRILSMCGHTFCEACINELILPNGDKFRITCPEDDTQCQLPTNNIKQFPINKALMRIIESNKSKSSFKDSFEMSKIVKQEEVQQDQQTKQLIIAIKQSQQQDGDNKNQQGENTDQTTQTNNNKVQAQQAKEQQQESEEDQNLCLLHQKPLEIVCVVDLQKICAKCAIFGKHKGHDFKSIQQIQQENDSFYHQLLGVYDQKTEIISRVQKKETKEDILSILTTNKESLTKQIRQRFKKLIDTVKNQEKKALAKLQKITQKIEKDIDDLYAIDNSLIQKYEQWERHSFQKLQIIEKGTFEEKLQLLLIDQSKKQKNIIIQGYELVRKMKAQEECIITKAEVFLSNINMKTNDKIFDFVQSYVELFDKPPEVPKPESQKIQQLVTNEDTKQKDNLIFDSGKKHSQDDLLESELHADDPVKEQTLQFVPNVTRPIKRQDDHMYEEVRYDPMLETKPIEQKFIPNIPSVKRQMAVEQMKRKVQRAQTTQFVPEIPNQHYGLKEENSFVSDKVVRPPKKKLKTIKVPQKYQKTLQNLYLDNSQTLDLTNAQLGDTIILQICQFIPGTKLKTIKFIRNKLTDEGVQKMLPYLSNSITLNLSQNLLTERVLDIFIDNRELLPKVKNIILSLNKIIERKHKNKIDELRKFDITVSV